MYYNFFCIVWGADAVFKIYGCDFSSLEKNGRVSVQTLEYKTHFAQGLFVMLTQRYRTLLAPFFNSAC